MSARAYLNHRGQRIEWTRFGNVRVDGKRIPRSQRFFWTAAWQAGEAEADEDIAAGRTVIYGSTTAFIESLSMSGEAEGTCDE
jgi:hypothetical protein